MKKFKLKKTAVCVAAALSFLGLFKILPGMPVTAYAMMISDELMEQALKEEFGNLGNLEEMEEIADDYYDMDIDQFTEEYLKKIESGEIQFDGLEKEKIIDPPLKMKATSDGNIRYTLPNGVYFDVTAPNGTITGNPITIYPASEVAAVVTKDGKSSSIFNTWRYSEPGNYRIKMIFYQFDEDQYENSDIYEVNYYFTITDRVAGNFGAIPAPDGFEIIFAKRDGVPLTIENPACLFLEGDGRFEIRYQDIATRSIYSTTSFVRDTTAPFLTFSKDLGDGKVKGPISFQKENVEDRVYLYYDGYTSEAIVAELTAAGTYGLEVVDLAGNKRMYTFEILRTRRLLNKPMVIFALIILLGSGVRLLLLRRDMKAI